MKLADPERHLRHNREGAALVFGSAHRCTRSPASRAIAKSRKGRCGPSASNWKFRGHKIYKRKTPPLRDTNPQGWLHKGVFRNQVAATRPTSTLLRLNDIC